MADGPDPGAAGATLADPGSAADAATAGRHLALLVPSLAGGGVARVMLNLAQGFAEQGHRVDLLVCRLEGAYRERLPPGTRIVPLAPGSALASRYLALRADPQGWRELLRPVLLPLRGAPPLPCLHGIRRYLLREQPDALLSAKTHTNLTAIWARRLAGVRTRLVVSEHSGLAQEMSVAKGRKWRWRFAPPLVGRAYRAADALVTVSEGVARELAASTGLPRERITTIYNPVFSPALLARAQEDPRHPWLAAGSPPVILSAGRFEAAKDFTVLLRAFALVRRQRQARLLILGEGRERTRLTQLAKRLRIDGDVCLPGFVTNPYAFMARARVFALSSRYEGLSNVLIEALGCGCPIVSTDCPSGPAEILAGGRYGRLAPVGNHDRLAEGIIAALDQRTDRGHLRRRAAEFSVANAVQRYLGLLLRGESPGTPGP